MREVFARGVRLGSGLLLLAALWTAGSPPGARGEVAVPALKAPDVRPDPEFRLGASDVDLHEHMQFLKSAISSFDIPPKNIPGIDYFISHLEKALKRGTDVPRDNILHNADMAREAARLAHNELSEAASPPMLPEVQGALKETSQALSQLLGRNRNSVDLLGNVADSAGMTASAMAQEPPESPGGLVPVETLCGIVSLEPELRALQDRLKRASKDLSKAKGLIGQAEQRTVYLDTLAKKAALLDKDAAVHAGQRRTFGRPDPQRNPMQSRDVILNANGALKRAAKKARAVADAMAVQLDPGKEGLRQAVDKALNADVLTQNAKTLEVQSGTRINYNHTVRMNNLIKHGYEAADNDRKPWWVGRAGMAKGEAQADASKMEDARERAVEGADAAEQPARSASSAIEDIGYSLGQHPGRYQAIVQRFSNAPTPKVAVRKTPPGRDHSSKPLKKPGAFSLKGQDLQQSFDTAGGEP